MSKINVAIIGLSSRSASSWASAAHLPYLISPAGKKKYQIVALCNSSVDAAKAAIKYYNLDKNVAAYGDPRDLAKDPNVQLVVVNTRVDQHYDSIKPSIEAGKNIYAEWPLAENLQKSQELADLAKSKGVSTLIGLQRRLSPIIVRLRKLIQEEKTLGKVLSSSVTAFGGTTRLNKLPPGLKYFTQRSVGGNPVTISFVHLLDYILHTLGDLETHHARLQLQRPKWAIVDSSTGGVVEEVTSDAPDLISLHGALKASSFVVEHAMFIASFRQGPPFKNQPSFVWSINCELGEIRIVNHSGLTLLGDQTSQPTIEIHNFEKDSVELLEWDWDQEQKSLPPMGRECAAVYEAYANGSGTAPTFEDALQRATLVDGLFKQYDAQH